MSSEHNKVKTVTGKVISNAMDKTIRVEVTGSRKHPQYNKYVPTRVVYFAHDEENVCNPGDVVEISFTRPLSKNKRWKLNKVVQTIE